MTEKVRHREQESPGGRIRAEYKRTDLKTQEEI